MPFNTTKLIISIVLPQLAGIVGAFFTVSAIPTWYATLTKPSFAPPNLIFGPVWTLLYLLMGIALYRIWQHGLEQKNVRFAFWMFIAHLGFNALWSILFFGLHNILYAFIDIVVLWVLIVALIALFWRIDRWAAYLLIPYLIWGSFAAVLNYSFLTLNSVTTRGTQVQLDDHILDDRSDLNDEDDREFLSLPGSGIWFSYPKGWMEEYIDIDDPLLPDDSPISSRFSGGNESITMAIFSQEIFKQYKKKVYLSAYFFPEFEAAYMNSGSRSVWENKNVAAIFEVIRPPKQYTKYGTQHVPTGVFLVELKNGSYMIVAGDYTLIGPNENPASVESHRAALYQKTVDLVQSIRPL